LEALEQGVLCFLSLVLAIAYRSYEVGSMDRYFRIFLLPGRSLTSLCDWILRRSTFEQQHAVILGVLWELVVNSNADVKISAAVLSKALVSDLCIYSKNLNIRKQDMVILIRYHKYSFSAVKRNVL